MRILCLTFYYEPDICAGSFRNTTLIKELSHQLNASDSIHVITTFPNRYNSFSALANRHEELGNIEIDRVKLPSHNSGFMDQAKAFIVYFYSALHLTKGKDYDLVYSSSSRLFTAFLGRIISNRKKIPLYIDIRDIFVDTLSDVLKINLFKSPVTGFLKILERYTFSRANHINLISAGFTSYFKKYANANYSFYPNGIDEEFLNIPPSGNFPKDRYIVTYAGNIGEGQGLHKIIPEAAKKLGQKYFFRIIGDGGMRETLIAKLEEAGVDNVELFLPMERERLKEYYTDSHFLFLHLNDYTAFEKVLPSKIFEYGALDKPIIAGVSGFAASFIKENLTNCIIFFPGDVNSLVAQLESYTFKFEQRIKFRDAFKRSQINKLLAESILSSVSECMK